MAYLDLCELTVRTSPGRLRIDPHAGKRQSMGKTLWRIDADGSDPSGFAGWIFYAVTDQPDKLPDVDAAYQALRGREGSVYLISSVTRVDSPTPDTDRPNVLDDGIHDQTSGNVIPFTAWRR